MITEAGNDPKVAGLVYIAAFAPDKGESVHTLIDDPPPGAPVPPILPPQDGFLLLDSEKFPASFAADVDDGTGRVHGRLAGPVGRGSSSVARSASPRGGQAKLVPGHERRPDDSAAGPARMSGRAGSPFDRNREQPPIYVSRPAAVAALIKQAASAVSSVAH